jgi:6-phosphogluconolactonase
VNADAAPASGERSEVDLHVAPDPEAASRLTASRLAELTAEALELRGRAHLALAGGTTPRHAYELVSERIGDWSRIEIWFGDERAVPPDDPESNLRMVRAALTGARGLREESIHRVEGERGAEEAANRYAEELRGAVPAGENGIPVLDVALQGMGPDGHTASLFPNHPALDAEGLCAPVHDAPKPPPDRITLTLPVLRSARRVVFLTTGEEKASAVAATLAGPEPVMPASLLVGRRTTMIVDEAAAAELDRSD